MLLRFFRSDLGALFVIVFLAVSSNAMAESLVGNITVEIREPITLTETRALDFGGLNIDSGGGEVRMRNNGTLIFVSGNVTAFGTSQSGRFQATGTPNAALSITLPTEVFLSGPGDDIRLYDFRRSAGNSPTLNNSGIRNFNVRSRLVIAPNQVPGTYSGTYTVTVNNL